MYAAGLEDWVLDLNDIESLPGKLDRLHEQVVPKNFVASTRAKNRTIGENLAARFRTLPQMALTC